MGALKRPEHKGQHLCSCRAVWLMNLTWLLLLMFMERTSMSHYFILWHAICPCLHEAFWWAKIYPTTIVKAYLISLLHWKEKRIEIKKSRNHDGEFKMSEFGMKYTVWSNPAGELSLSWSPHHYCKNQWTTLWSRGAISGGNLVFRDR